MLSRSDNLVIDRDNLPFLVVQAAATIIYSCEARRTDAEFSPGTEPDKYDSVAVVLARYMNWSEHGYTYSLERMAEFVYGFASECITDPHLAKSLTASEVLIVTDALKAFQKWKTQYYADHRDEYKISSLGPNDANYPKDWTDMNAIFLEAVTAK